MPINIFGGGQFHLTITRGAPPLPPEPTPPPDPQGISVQGFGAQVTGGAGKSVYHVTNLNDSGAGSLREGMALSDRYIVFDVGGTINITGDFASPTVTQHKQLGFGGSNVTIDGSTAPAPGITLAGGNIWLEGTAGTPLQNIVISQIRVQDPVGNGNLQDDCITFYNYTHDVVIDHCSLRGQNDGAIDIEADAALGVAAGIYNVSVQWCLLGPRTESYGAYEDQRVGIGHDSHFITLHHNLFMENGARTDPTQNPLFRLPECGDIDFPDHSPSLTAVVAGNLIWGPHDARYGTAFYADTVGIAEKNYYYLDTVALTTPCVTTNSTVDGTAYSSGNYSRSGQSTTPENPIARPSVPSWAEVTLESTAALAAAAVVSGAGCSVGGRDATDQAYIDAINAVGL